MTPMADIGDIYAWNTSDATKVNLAMTVSPADNGMRQFSPAVTYAFHVNSRPSFLGTPTETQVRCKFASNTDGECWVVAADGTVKDYVKGDFSATTGKTSKDGKLKVFAGRRSDPFFFNLGGAKAVIAQAEATCGTLNGTPGSAARCPPTGSAAQAFLDAAKCIKAVDKNAATGLRTLLMTKPSGTVIPGTSCGSADIDCFKSFNVMALVVQVDNTLVNEGTNVLVSVWGSTHTGS